MKLLNEAIDSRLIPEKKNVLNILIDNYSKELDSWQLDSKLMICSILEMMLSSNFVISLKYKKSMNS